MATPCSSVAVALGAFLPFGDGVFGLNPFGGTGADVFFVLGVALLGFVGDSLLATEGLVFGNKSGGCLVDVEGVTGGFITCCGLITTDIVCP